MIETHQIQPLFDRENDNAPGPFYIVKDTCLICEVPLLCAPKNISWDDEYECTGCVNHCRVERQPENEAETEQQIEAAVNSCVEAIRYCGTDSKILTRFQQLRRGDLCDVLCNLKKA